MTKTNEKILITGGSGFIGTNVLDYYLSNSYEVINLDIKPPQNPAHRDLWKETDILDYEKFYKEINKFKPDYVIHLAARANLTGKSLQDYSENTVGVKNLIKIGNSVKSIKKIMFASTILVCERGYVPESDHDYCPPNLYGESKAIGEKLVRSESKNFDWVIVRPTSIWGPWFGPTYRQFFDMIIKGRYFNFSGKMSTKSYGYIGNVVYQISELLKSDSTNSGTFHIGDYEPTNIKEWSKEIASELNKRVLTIPRIIVWAAAKAGDIIQLFGVRFPINSFRFRNMTSDSIKNMKKTKEIVPYLKYDRKEANRITLNWMLERKDNLE